MSSNPAIHGSGDGTRPTTDGGVDNIGAGSGFATGKSAIGEANVGPAPSADRVDARTGTEATKKDDSVPFDLKGDTAADSNVEPGPPPTNI